MNKVYLVVSIEFRDREADEELVSYLSDAAIMAECRLSHGFTTYPTNPDATAYASLEDIVRDAQDVAGAFAKFDSQEIHKDNSK